jgi:hypothetical protein
VLLGLTDASRDKTVKVRHELAYKAFCKAERSRPVPRQRSRPITFSGFETRKEKEMLKDLAVQLIKMVEERARKARRAPLDQ